MNKILIYTYNPFGKYKRNAAKELVKGIRSGNVKKIYLDTNYRLEKLFGAIEDWKPDIVLGIGQNFEKKAAVERTFKNIVKNSVEERTIGKQHSYRSQLPVEKMASILKVKISDDAGTLNCNYSTYVLLSKKVRAGFIHVPSVKYFQQRKYLPRFEKLIDFLQRN